MNIIPNLVRSLLLTTLLGLALAACATRPDASLQGDLILENARIVDPAAREVREGALLIRDGNIVAELDGAPRGFAGQTVDLAGRWVIPGLNDMHVHSFGNLPSDFPGTPGVASRVLAVGVTGILDLFGDENSLYQIRAQQHSGELRGAELFTSLSCLTAPSGHCTEYGVATRTMSTSAEARAVVAALAQRNPDVVKIVYEPSRPMPSIDRETLAAAIDEASRRGLKTIIHIGTWDEVRDAIDAGATAVTHIPNEPIPVGMAELMARSGTVWIPTLAVETDYMNFVLDPAVLDNPMARMLTTPNVIEAYQTGEFGADARRDRIAYQDHNPILRASVKAAADAGVTILAGTDTGNRGTLQGYSLHRELMIMVEAGLSPWQALASATTEAGDFLGRPFGVQPGDEANLVVLDASPIADISNTQAIFMVIQRGEIVDRTALLDPVNSGLPPAEANDP